MMLLPYTKLFFIILGSFYVFKKLLHISAGCKSYFIDITCSLFLSLIAQCLKQYIGVLDFCILILLLSTSLKIHYKFSFRTSTITATLSFAMAVFASLMAVFLTMPVKIGFTRISFSGFLSDYITYLIIGGLQMLLLKLPFYFKRFKNGMPFLQQGKFENTGFLISILMILIISIYRGSPNTDFKITILTLVIPFTISILFLFRWWYKRLKSLYLEKLKNREIESLRQEIEHLQEEISDLKQNNSELSSLIHKDNKLIPAMEYAVTTLFHTATFTDNETKEQAESLLTQLKSISNERNGILSTYENKHKPTPKTGIISVDAMCHYMEQKALALGVNFRFTFASSVKYLTDNIIDENKLTTLIADLTENAMISTRECETKNVLLCIGLENNIYTLSVYDSGKSFERDSLLHLGVRRFTTHPKEGGSGIGLMTTLEILKTCKASFLLDECNDNAAYTKAISVCFDGLGQIRVHSKRPELLDLSHIRTDIIFLS